MLGETLDELSDASRIGDILETHEVGSEAGNVRGSCVMLA